MKNLKNIVEGFFQTSGSGQVGVDTRRMKLIDDIMKVAINNTYTDKDEYTIHDDFSVSTKKCIFLNAGQSSYTHPIYGLVKGLKEIPFRIRECDILIISGWDDLESVVNCVDKAKEIRIHNCNKLKKVDFGKTKLSGNLSIGLCDNLSDITLPKLKKSLELSYVPIKNLNFLPQIMLGDLIISDCLSLKDTSGLPKSIGGTFKFWHNQAVDKYRGVPEIKMDCYMYDMKNNMKGTAFDTWRQQVFNKTYGTKVLSKSILDNSNTDGIKYKYFASQDVF